MNTQRPLTLTLAAILLGLLAVLSVIPASAPAGSIPAIVIYAGYVLVILALVAALGLWRHKQWAMWLAIVVAAVQILSASPGLVAAPTAALRITVIVGLLFYAVIIVLVLLPASRRAYA